MTIPKSRPREVDGKVIRARTACGSLYVTVTVLDGQLFEVFATLGKSGGCAAAQSEAVCRMVSICLRAGVEPKAIIKQLTGIRCPNASFDDGGIQNMSCADAIAKVIESQYNRLQGGKDDNSAGSGPHGENDPSTEAEG